MPQRLNPERSFGYQVRRCHRSFDRLLEARLSPHNLKSGFWYYLRALWMQDRVTQRELSELTNVTETTTVSLINGMVKNGLVTCGRDTADRRKKYVSLTPRGRQLEGKLMKHAIEINRVATKGIPQEELNTCLFVLARMSRNLQNELGGLGSSES